MFKSNGCLIRIREDPQGHIEGLCGPKPVILLPHLLEGLVRILLRVKKLFKSFLLQGYIILQRVSAQFQHEAWGYHYFLAPLKIFRPKCFRPQIQIFWA